MELHPRALYQRSSWPFFFFLPSSSSSSSSPPAPHPNHVHWTQTPDSHLFTADLPGVRREEIRVEVEDSLYMVIRTELLDDGDDDDDDGGGGERRQGFMRKFRLPRLVDLDHISADYENGVLTVTVPRVISVGGRLRVDPREFPPERNSVARAA